MVRDFVEDGRGSTEWDEVAAMLDRAFAAQIQTAASSPGP